MKKMKKSYYIIESIPGCFGCLGTVSRFPERYSSKREAEREARKRQKNAAEGILFWSDFEWI